MKFATQPEVTAMTMSLAQPKASQSDTSHASASSMKFLKEVSIRISLFVSVSQLSKFERQRFLE